MLKTKIITSIISLICVSTVAANANATNTTVEESPITIDANSIPVSKNTFLVANGESEYKIVIGENCSGTVELAAQEFQRFFSEATNVALPIIRDTNLFYNENVKYISLGDTTLYEQSLIKLDESIGHSGVQIETLNKTLFLLGQDDSGVLYAVYDLLAVLFNFEYFGNEAYSLDKNVSNLPLRHFKHFLDIPDIPYRMSTSGTNTYNLTEMNRFRQQDWYTSVFTMINSVPWHNCFEYVAHAVAGHENYWYSEDKTQLCYTARGDATEYEAMQQACLTSLIKQVIEYPDKNCASLTMYDGNTVCGCSACTAIKNKYNDCGSALHILFCNDLRNRLENWFNTAEGLPYKRDFKLYFFAYLIASDAPINYNASTGEYSLIDGLKCNDDVAVLYAPIDMDYKAPLDNKYNANYVQQLHNWSHLSKEMYIWTYDWCFRSYFAPYDTFENLQPLYKELVSCGNVKYHFQEGGHYMKEGGSCWEALKIYLNSKLAWDCNLNTEKLINNFFKYYFQEAADSMKSAFDSFRVFSEHLKNTDDTYFSKESCEADYYLSKYWPKGLELSINNLMDKAFDDIEKVKTADLNRYELLFNRISLEKLSPLYLLIYFYGNELSTLTLESYRNQFKEFISNLGITKGDYGDPISDTFTRLGIK